MGDVAVWVVEVTPTTATSECQLVGTSCGEVVAGGADGEGSGRVGAGCCWRRR